MRSAVFDGALRRRRSIFDFGARVLAWLTFVTLTFTSAGFQVAGGLAVADVALAATVLCCVGAADLSRVRTDRWQLALLVGALAVLFGGSLGALASGRPAAWRDMVAFVIVVGLSLGFVALAPPALRASGFLEPRLALIAGGSLGSLWGLATGPTMSLNRVSGLTVHPNSFGFAGFLTAAVSISVVMDVGGVRGRLAALGVVVGAAGCAQSGSRAALGALLVVFGLAAVVALRRKPMVTVGSSMVLIVAALLTIDRWSASVGIGRLLGSDTSAQRSDAERSVLRASSFDLIDRWPFTGSGFGDALRAHALPIQLWQVAGVLGMLAFALWSFVLVYRPIRSVFFGELGPFEAGLLVGPGIAVWTVVSNSLWELEPWVGIALATAAVASRRSPHPIVLDRRSLVEWA